jgi:hypothetical protein
MGVITLLVYKGLALIAKDFSNAAALLQSLF